MVLFQGTNSSYFINFGDLEDDLSERRTCTLEGFLALKFFTAGEPKSAPWFQGADFELGKNPSNFQVNHSFKFGGVPFRP